MDKSVKDDRGFFTCKDCKFIKGCPKYYENEKTKMVRCTEFKKA